MDFFIHRLSKFDIHTFRVYMNFHRRICFPVSILNTEKRLFVKSTEHRFHSKKLPGIFKISFRLRDSHIFYEKITGDFKRFRFSSEAVSLKNENRS